MANWNDPGILIAIYAAIIATGSLAWNIINLLLGKTRKLKVEYCCYIYKDENNNFAPIVSTVELKITNIGNDKLFINDIILLLCNNKIKIEGKSTNKISSIYLNHNYKFPHKLEKGDVCQISIKIKYIINIINNKIVNNKKVRFLIKDTFGKEYKSSKILYDELINNFNEESMCNERIQNNIMGNKI